MQSHDGLPIPVAIPNVTGIVTSTVYETFVRVGSKANTRSGRLPRFCPWTRSMPFTRFPRKRVRFLCLRRPPTYTRGGKGTNNAWEYRFHSNNASESRLGTEDYYSRPVSSLLSAHTYSSFTSRSHRLRTSAATPTVYVTL